ncbi:hypothetical protein TR80_017750 [Xanthomonas campestris]|nr:hypothetical protein TR80_017750 [Xanthomonas campestris]
MRPVRQWPARYTRGNGNSHCARDALVFHQLAWATQLGGDDGPSAGNGPLAEREARPRRSGATVASGVPVAGALPLWRRLHMR